MVRSLRRVPTWSSKLAVERFTAKRADLQRRLAIIHAQRDAGHVEEQRLLSLLDEVTAQLESEPAFKRPRVPAASVEPGSAPTDVASADHRRPKRELRYVYDEASEAWAREPIRRSGLAPCALPEPPCHLDELTQRAFVLFGVPGLFHLMAVAEATQHHITISREAIPTEAIGLAFAPTLAHLIFSLSAFQAILDPSDKGEFLSRLLSLAYP